MTPLARHLALVAHYNSLPVLECGNQTRKTVLAAFPDGNVTLDQLVPLLPFKRETVQQSVGHLVKDGKVTRVCRGIYRRK